MLVSHQLKRKAWKIWQLINKNTHTLIYAKWLCRSHGFLGVTVLSIVMERGHSTRLRKHIPSLRLAYIPSQGDIPCWSLTLTSLFHTGTSCKAGSGSLKRHHVVPLSEGQWLQSAGDCSEGQMSTTHSQCRRHRNSTFLISKLTFHLDLIQRTVLAHELWNWLSYNKIYASTIQLVMNTSTL